MTFRRVLFKVHLYGGLAAALFLVVAGVTGAMLAFEADYDRWTHPSLWNATTRDSRVSEEALLEQVEARFAPARVEQISVGGAGIVQVFTLTSGDRVFVDPYDGSVRGVRRGLSRLETVMWFVERLHVGLTAGSFGQWVVDITTAAALLLISTGLVLWWRRKRWRINWAGSWRRVTWDLHNVLGVCGAATLLVLSLTGFFLAFDSALLWVTHTSPWHVPPLPRSVVSAPLKHRRDLDQLAHEADRALPAASTYAIRLPMRDRSPVQFLKHAPDGAGHSTVFVDQYAGTILRVDDFNTLPGGYRVREFVRAVHTGDLLGAPTRTLVSLSSLGLVSLVITGTLVWWKKEIRG
jgi:uncharacterized iron-regulated membrane protein